MGESIRIALAQINTVVGDLEGNSKQVIEKIRHSEKARAQFIVFPELTIPGYPPEDLLLKPRFIIDNKAWLGEIAKQTREVPVLLGFVDDEDGQIYNAAAVLHRGKIAATYHKIALPNYSVFDEKRYFEPGNKPLVVEFNDIKFGITICEDIWVEDVITESQAFLGGAEILLNISASPYYVEKRKVRLALGIKHARRSRAIMVINNLVGGQDELIFDGNSLVVDHQENILAEGQQFQEDFFLIDLDPTELRRFRERDAAFTSDKRKFQPKYDVKFVRLEPVAFLESENGTPPQPYSPLQKWDEVYHALVLGTQDYVHKNGFETVVIGLSGGIDSALTTAIAVDALGKENVVAVMMPSEYTSEDSMKDARELADNLGIRAEVIPIKTMFDTYLDTMSDIFEGQEPDITEENLQARIRGNILMALSNKFNWLVLTTGNKSETSVGYSTLYGDTAGGFAVIKDVPKTWVYKLCERRNQNAGEEIIPRSIITKPPTAELRANQKDQDSLPPYELLDAILEEFVEKDKSVREIIEQGFPRDVVKEVARLVDINEYKRRQAPPGIKITHKAFGKDRRMPITNRYKT